MPAHNLPISENNANRIDRLVRAGRIADSTSVVQAGLEVLEKQEARDRAKLETLRAAAAVGLEDLKTGRVEAVALEDVEAFLAGLLETPDRA
ncbi:hypothetical protein [Elstera litoralis]|uniref:hypothetical protein n=1 Tax=Elstera litoralis TaxID=552518 RepID=UPI0006987D79|nr:hypothetical protein [Elstera litoralis]